MKTSTSASEAPHTTIPRVEILPLPWWKTPRTAKAALALLAGAIIAIGIWIFEFRPFLTTDDARVAMTLARLAPANVGGRIERVSVTEGSHVNAGDILVEIDHRVPQANYDKAKAKADLTRRELDRTLRLAADGSATSQALEQAKAAAATADVEIKLAEVALENTYLKSPFDGVVVQKLAEPGNLLEQNQTALVIADETNAWIAANIEETAVGAVTVGQPVQIMIDEGGSLKGTVSEIRRSVASQFALIPSDSGSGNFTKVVQRIPIKVTIDNKEKLPLRVGQSAEIKIKVR
jgi:membrane fusion protein (multidrug efflux system)